MDETAVGSADSLYSRLDLTNRGSDWNINIDSAVAMTDGTVTEVDYDFKIRATVNGEVSLIKEVRARIVVCGFEVVTNDPATVLSFSLEIDPAAQDTLQEIASLFTSNDSYCPPNSYSIKMDESGVVDPSVAQLLNFDMHDATTLKVYPETKGIYSFFIRA